jgi:hypothetical protein
LRGAARRRRLEGCAIELVGIILFVAVVLLLFHAQEHGFQDPLHKVATWVIAGLLIVAVFFLATHR